MAIQLAETTVLALDGSSLDTTLVQPGSAVSHAAVFVHGAGATRDEGGFFTTLAHSLARVGIGSLRFDLRGRGESDGPQHLDDIRSAFDHIRGQWGAPALSVVGMGFGGGLAAHCAARGGDDLSRLVLLNPQFRPHEVLGDIVAPTLIVHGTEDTFVESSRSAARQLQVEHELVEIEGAQHGFAVPGDPYNVNPQSQQWQAFVIKTVVDWLALS
ncbi:lysophospholipase [Allokutzneria sp. A3M-2-11 16]|uniref:alpha/beta hydrolase n=1 Tax=Allokutzneria sp. A3M-2-11 16 TaxID=2962043 RepID=UPI0020B87AD8|nr:alpha/beta fold hydrolase [Allokutzneria sp. A3M-2-11 16]MCP3803303.1 lysophospholipase [Allokutzneria sp. A3M-2-11 16]